MNEDAAQESETGGPLAFLFAVGKQAFGVHPDHVLEVLTAEDPTRVPFAPTWVEGVINARGSVIPVIDITGYFGLEAEADLKRNRLVIMGLGEISFAFACDRIMGVETLDSSVLEEPLGHLPGLLRECCTSQFKQDDQVVLLLDSRLFLEQSRDRVKAS